MDQRGLATIHCLRILRAWLREWVDVPFVVRRTAVGVFAILATAALALASMGLLSLISYGVTLCTREVGIRIALGATQGSMMGLFLGGAMRLVVIGTTRGARLV